MLNILSPEDVKQDLKSKISEYLSSQDFANLSPKQQIVEYKYYYQILKECETE